MLGQVRPKRTPVSFVGSSGKGPAKLRMRGCDTFSLCPAACGSIIVAFQYLGPEGEG